MTETPTDDELVRRAADGDENAITRLLLTHHEPMLRYIDSRLSHALRSKVSAEDILQETFSDVFRGIHRFVPQRSGSFAAWLRTIADNRIRNANRDLTTIKRGGLHQHVSLFAPGATSHELGDALTDLSSLPTLSLEREEVVYAVQTHLADLPSEQRKAMRLRYLEGKGVQQAANEMQRTTGAVRGLLRRAKLALREALGRSSKWFHRK